MKRQKTNTATAKRILSTEYVSDSDLDPSEPTASTSRDTRQFKTPRLAAATFVSASSLLDASVPSESDEGPKQNKVKNKKEGLKQTSLANTFSIKEPIKNQLAGKVPTIVECKRIMKEVFKKESFRGQQLEIIKAAIQPIDILVIAPTGMGKSICFQVPSVAYSHGVSIVITPLLSLMSNQTTLLKQLGVACSSLCSTDTRKDQTAIIKDICSSKTKTRLLYMTPERFCSEGFIDVLTKIHKLGNFNRLIIDEAHCISEWGHDFRKDYRQLGVVRANFPDVPVMALTASATPTVQKDICKILDLREPQMRQFLHPFNRPNLFYEVRFRTEDLAAQCEDIYDFIARLQTRGKAAGKSSVSGIIYCRNRTTCDQLAAYLSEQGIKAGSFHRGRTTKENERSMDLWMRSDELTKNRERRVDCICATIAFGMGIDKSSVTYVIHFDLPKSFEGFYQETGRAGRDGDGARCLLYYSREDSVKMQYYIDQGQNRRENTASEGFPVSQRSPNSFKAMVDYCEGITVCRHITICKYFGEYINEKDPEQVKSYCNKTCDICSYPEKVAKRKEILSSDDYVGSQAPRLLQEVSNQFVEEVPSILERKESNDELFKDPARTHKELNHVNIPRKIKSAPLARKTSIPMVMPKQKSALTKSLSTNQLAPESLGLSNNMKSCIVPELESFKEGPLFLTSADISNDSIGQPPKNHAPKQTAHLPIHKSDIKKQELNEENRPIIYLENASKPAPCRIVDNNNFKPPLPFHSAPKFVPQEMTKIPKISHNSGICPLEISKTVASSAAMIKRQPAGKKFKTPFLIQDTGLDVKNTIKDTKTHIPTKITNLENSILDRGNDAFQVETSDQGSNDDLSPVSLHELHLDVCGSRKASDSLRLNELAKITQTLRQLTKVGKYNDGLSFIVIDRLWSQLGNLEENLRQNKIDMSARALEFQCLSDSASSGGYVERMNNLQTFLREVQPEDVCRAFEAPAGIFHERIGKIFQVVLACIKTTT